MITQGEQGIRREGVDTVFVEDETRKSNLILKANLLARADLPDHLRRRIQEHVRLLQTRRVRWLVEFAPQAVAMAAS